MIRKVILVMVILSAGLVFSVPAEQQLSVTTYVPAPSAVFKDMEVKGNLFIGTYSSEEFSGFGQSGLSMKGKFHLQPKVTEGWEMEDLGITPVEGQVIFATLFEGQDDETIIKRKIWFYDGLSYNEMISLPQIFADGLTVKVKVQTSLPKIYIGDQGPFGSSTGWVNMTLYPGKEDSVKGGCNVYQVYRECSMGSCGIRFRGSASGSPYVRVWIKVPDKSLFHLHCYNKYRCRTTYDCEWRDNTDSDKDEYHHVAYGYHYNNCGCMYCDCGVYPYTLDYY